MRYSVFVTDEAHADASDAYFYYENKAVGLGSRFLSALSHVYDMLSYYSIVKDDHDKIFRDVIVKGFPYVVIYEITGQEVWVFAVHNTYRNLRFTE